MNVPLSKLVASKNNPRRIKPEREAHRRLVASIRAHGLLEPLVVHTIEEGKYRVIAGNRRLAALKEVHRGEDVKVPCIAKDVDAEMAASMSLAENFVREPMHPLDEAEAFARLASEECKGVPAIAEEFGVSETYVRQRMKLADLAEPVRASLRKNEITLAIAETLAAVPPERQEELWKEMGGKPRSAQQVRTLIEQEWIPASHALFDLKTLNPASISHDLFGGEVLIRRDTFLSAQTEALLAERNALIEDGWRGAEIIERGRMRDHTLAEAPVEYDTKTQAKLDRIAQRRAKLEAIEIKDEETGKKIEGILDELDGREGMILAEARGTYSEETKAIGMVLLILDPDGRIERRHCVPRPDSRSSAGGDANGAMGTNGPVPVPTCDDLSPKQLAAVLTHQALAVREAIAKDRLVRKRLIVLALHERVRTDAITIRHTANGTRLHARSGESLRSEVWDAQQARRKEIDPLTDQEHYDEVEAYTQLERLSDKELDALIAVLIVESLTNHAQRSTPLIDRLAEELSVSLRTQWTPDASWLNGYCKAQLADLVGKFRPAARASALQRKKSELVSELAGLFQRAATPGEITDTDLAQRANAWLPARLMPTPTPALAAAESAGGTD